MNSFSTGKMKGMLISKKTSALLQKSLQNREEIFCSGLFLSARWAVVSQVASEKPQLIILPNREAAEYCSADLYNLTQGDCVFFLPESGKSVERSNYKSSLGVQRTAAIGKILEKADEKFFIVTYSEALEEKDLAVVCLFGSGCGACQRELRALDKAYRLYQDRVAVIALSLDRTRDTEAVLNAFQEAQGLSFPLGKDPNRTARFLKINMYPAFMIVSAISEVVYVEVNGPASIDHFVELIDTCLDGASPADAESDFGTVCTGDSCLIPEDV